MIFELSPEQIYSKPLYQTAILRLLKAKNSKGCEAAAYHIPNLGIDAATKDIRLILGLEMWRDLPPLSVARMVENESRPTRMNETEFYEISNEVISGLPRLTL